MRSFASAIAISAALVCAQQIVPVEPPHDAGQSVTAAYEGWFANPDGSFSLLFGYFNRNFKQELDVPTGPENRIEPGGPDRGQPTHFLPRRQWGVFTITVPKDFGNNQLTWKIVANLSSPVTLTIWVADDANIAAGATPAKTSPVTVSWSKFRGPGSVRFSNDKPPVEIADFKGPEKAVFKGRATTSASFSEPGEYVLRVVANDWSGEGGRGFQCCWSNAQVKVSVK